MLYTKHMLFHMLLYWVLLRLTEIMEWFDQTTNHLSFVAHQHLSSFFLLFSVFQFSFMQSFYALRRYYGFFFHIFPFILFWPNYPASLNTRWKAGTKRKWPWDYSDASFVVAIYLILREKLDEGVEWRVKGEMGGKNEREGWEKKRESITRGRPPLTNPSTLSHWIHVYYTSNWCIALSTNAFHLFLF